MPTFMFFKDGDEVGKVVGADPNKLKVRTERYETWLSPSLPLSLSLAWIETLLGTDQFLTDVNVQAAIAAHA